MHALPEIAGMTQWMGALPRGYSRRRATCPEQAYLNSDRRNASEQEKRCVLWRPSVCCQDNTSLALAGGIWAWLADRWRKFAVFERPSRIVSRPHWPLAIAMVSKRRNDTD
jgi:hypothetical protein